MRLCILFVGALVASIYACKSQTVVPAAHCSDPCCGGDPSRIDCGETPAIACLESGDPCTAQAFGCKGGVFFQVPQATLPASCPATDGAADVTTTEPDASTGTFDQTDGAAADAAPDVGPDATDAGLDATNVAIDAADAGLDAMTDAGVDATPDGSP